jgi:hypothetical protein
MKCKPGWIRHCERGEGATAGERIVQANREVWAYRQHPNRHLGGRRYQMLKFSSILRHELALAGTKEAA